MANKQASKTNKTAPSATVRREDQPGYKKVNRNKKRSTGVARVQQGNTLMDAIDKRDLGFDGDHATARSSRPASQWKQIKYGATKPAHEIRAIDRRIKMEDVPAATAASPAPIAAPATRTTQAPARRRYVDHRKQAILAVEFPKLTVLTQDPAAFYMLEEILQAFGGAKATKDKKKFEVTLDLALTALVKRNPEARANEKAVAKGTRIAKEALNWAHDQLSESAAAK